MRRRATHIKAGSNQFRQERIRETAWRQAVDKLSSNPGSATPNHGLGKLIPPTLFAPLQKEDLKHQLIGEALIRRSYKEA